ncbi:hypothetical protein [Clostridioides difficile]|nr:hypothetical protein [Clostridioides difficile]EHJ31108.1 hypothetical protein HMPREF1122_01592 [Clostridioides difficile 002-P50-2011]EHJ31378.1 hypothetical protein HMPREF1123_01201 [Clostridioides difficile 050-P50-2011]EQF61730.1 hypothetical protein QG7_0843 [Clostridioides difficile CD175]EQK34781.1 hypothetical protein QW3_0798 [Clostridioides difficile P74]CCL04887.1 hypothetical protein BN167_750085 [Clostridioides difficile E13]CCL06106.1 hypothetical protein BN168_330105 [Clostr
MRKIGIVAYSIINYISISIYMTLFGLTLGVQPLISFVLGKQVVSLFIYK